MATDYDNLDLDILTCIDTVREKHDACTARVVATVLRTSSDVVRYRLQKMRGEGLVSWNDIPGSLIRLAPIPLTLVETTDEEPLDSDEPSASSSTPKKKPSSPRSRQAAKKGQ